MKSGFQYLLIAVAAITLASCNNSNTQGRWIPSNAAIALHIDGKSLSSKLPWEEIKNNPLFKEAYSDSSLSASLKKILDNPENSGIDTKTDLLFFALKDSVGGYIAFEGSIKDEAAFKAFNAQVTENAKETEKDGVNFISHFPLCVGWNKEKFVYVFDAPELGQMDQLSKRMLDDSIDISNHKPRDIGTTCRTVFELKESNSLGNEKKFTKLLKEPGDMHFWMNSEELSKNSASSAALAMVNLEKLYKGSITTAAVNFDNGKIGINMFSYAGEELTKLYKKYSGGKVNEDMLKRMPGKDVNAIIAMNFKPEGIKELLKLLGLDGFVNLAQPALGFGLDDFIKANKGDVMFGLSDLTLVTDTTADNELEEGLKMPAMPKPQFNFIFAASIGDKDAFTKLINAGKKAGGALATNPATASISYNSNGTYFALGNSKENTDKFFAGSNNNAAFISKINGEPFGGYFNIKSLLTSFESQATKDSSAKVLYDASIKLWDDITWKGGDVKDDAMTQTIEINLQDKSTNSLKQLNQYAFKISEVYKAKRKKEKEDMMAFEDAATPAVEKEPATAPAQDVKEK